MADAEKNARRHVRYPNHYAWLILVATLDLLLTFIILVFGGREANGLAAGVIARFGLFGLVVFKLAMTLAVILIAEEVGRRDERKGRKFAEYAIVITAFPVIFALTLIYTQV